MRALLTNQDKKSVYCRSLTKKKFLIPCSFLTSHLQIIYWRKLYCLLTKKEVRLLDKNKNQNENEEVENGDMNETPEQDSTFYSEISREDKPASEENASEEEEMGA